MMTTTEVILAIAVGVAATVIMDIWAVLMRWLFGVTPANYCLVGRWFCHMPVGTFAHANIAKTKPKQGECVVGWVAHYIIGVAYAVLLVMVFPGWLDRPSFLPALVVGWVTLLFPFLIMHPSFGLGVASARAPKPVPARMRSVMAHTAFGVGLYVAANLSVVIRLNV